MPSQQGAYRDFLAKLSVGLPIFFQPWWLDAVAGPNGWDARMARDKSGEVQAVWPFAPGRKYGLAFLSPPPLCPGLGPRLLSSGGPPKRHRRHDREWSLYTDLIDQLPDAYFRVGKSEYDAPNLMPFLRRKWQVGVRYSYVFPPYNATQDLWQGLAGRTRTAIRKARELLRVESSSDGMQLYDICQKSYAHRGSALTISRTLFDRLLGHILERESGRLLKAVDEQGRVHAMQLCVWDTRSAYNLIQGSDPELRASGANALLLWHAIEAQAETGRSFDFEGSQLPGVEEFFRSFGAPMRPYYLLEYAHPLLRPLLSVLRR